MIRHIQMIVSWATGHGAPSLGLLLQWRSLPWTWHGFVMVNGWFFQWFFRCLWIFMDVHGSWIFLSMNLLDDVYNDFHMVCSDMCFSWWRENNFFRVWNQRIAPRSPFIYQILPDLTSHIFFPNSFGLSWWGHAFWPHRRIQAMMRSLCVTTTWLSRGPVAWWDDGWGEPSKD